MITDALPLLEWDNSALAHRAVAALSQGEVQLWFATLSRDDADLAALARNLSLDEQERAERFRAEEPRRHFMVGRAVMRQLLAALLNTAASSLVFGYGPHGKPFLNSPVSRRDLRFNLSHSGQLVVVALAQGREVGVDLERIDRPTNWPLLAERIFSARELRELRALPESQQRQAFFNGWTRKEAYLKATGEGLTEDFAAIEVTLTPGQEPQLLGLPTRSEDTREWAAQEVSLPPGYVGAVVFEKEAWASVDLDP